MEFVALPPDEPPLWFCRAASKASDGIEDTAGRWILRGRVPSNELWASALKDL